MAYVKIESRVVPFDATVSACRDEVAQFAADVLPGGRLDSRPGEIRHTAPMPGWPHGEAHLRIESRRVSIAGVPTEVATLRLDVISSVAMGGFRKAALRNQANALLAKLEARLRRTVPLTFVRDSGEPFYAHPAILLADEAAAHLGRPEIFAALIEQGSWSGQVERDGVGVDTALTFVATAAGAAGQRLKVEACVRGAELERHGVARAREVTSALVEQLTEHLDANVIADSRVQTVTVQTPPREVPPLFYADVAVPAAGRAVDVAAPAPHTRAEVTTVVVPRGDHPGLVSATLRVSALDAPPDPALVHALQSNAESAVQAVADALERDHAAPAFTVAASAARVREAMARQLGETFPGETVRIVGDVVRVNDVVLGDTVRARVEVRCRDEGPGTTAVVFTGALYGIGVQHDEKTRAAARAAFRREVARAATEIEHAVVAELEGPTPPRWDGLG